jgi:Zn-finger nucleic acid-binding protein
VSGYRDALGEPPGPCPRCKDVPLRVLARGETRVSVCRGCGGMFARHDTLERLAGGDAADLYWLASEAARAPPQPPPRPGEVACPWCQTPMLPVAVPTARCSIDVCPAHGAWFDRWEAQLVAHTLRDPQAARALRLRLHR